MTIEQPGVLITLKGDELKYDFNCESLEELQDRVISLKWLLPPLLSLVFRDPPIVQYIRGRIGKTSFRWEHRPDQWLVQTRPVTTELLENHVGESFAAMPLLCGVENRRFAAAMSYFHVAVRLHVSGDSPWEFMAESILNYAKCLDVLFSTSENSRDDIRRALLDLGYSKDEIEGQFIPVHVLRSYVDVAHPKVAIYKPSDLKVLYRYMNQVEHSFCELLLRAIQRVAAGTFAIPQPQTLALNAQERKDMDRLVQSMKSRLPDEYKD